jgi:hypothetical protein
LLDVLTSGLCSPLNGSAVLTALKAETGCGLLDRLIADDYASRGIKALTNDRKMARLPEVAKLGEASPLLPAARLVFVHPVFPMSGLSCATVAAVTQASSCAITALEISFIR